MRKKSGSIASTKIYLRSLLSIVEYLVDLREFDLIINERLRGSMNGEDHRYARYASLVDYSMKEDFMEADANIEKGRRDRCLLENRRDRPFLVLNRKSKGYASAKNNLACLLSKVGRLLYRGNL